jgi:AcrR family transcriptional regulator
MDTTSDRIITAALELFSQQGVKKTDLDEVARQAGVTRVTVYRYFGDKEGLVRAACQRITDAFGRAAADGPPDSVQDMDQRLGQLAGELRALPQGNLLRRLDEISCLYPKVHAEFRLLRQVAVDRLLEQTLLAAKRDGSLRDDLHPDVLRAVFWAAVIGLIENPALISSNVSLADVLTTVQQVFRHGILKPPAPSADPGRRPGAAKAKANTKAKATGKAKMRRAGKSS